MGLFYEKIMRPVLFRMDPEDAHDHGKTVLSTLGKTAFLRNAMQRMNQHVEPEPIELFGLKFPNRVGLAAGMDKNAEFWRACGALGFGHVEIGTVTFHEQPGNPRPRLFRLPEHGAIINRMGFNNDGAEAVAKRLKAVKADKDRKNLVLGINIGKSKVTPLDEAAEDYLGSFKLLADYADYFTINVSSPNTPDLRKLQEADQLSHLLKTLDDENRKRAKTLGVKKIPMLLKIAPDLSFRQIDSVLEQIQGHGLSGIIATNTTLKRPLPADAVKEDGGLSGRPLHPFSYDIVKYIALRTERKLPIIAVGGIEDARTASAMLSAGASLVQVYSALIYKGPFLPRDIARGVKDSRF